ncbi:response regulator transcription factor [Tunicatimonas pelagia]|uniref:response regulator transcription factor n=1 Tax=Tunicatimonas pelagia TaxID=931531 RepID=UPI00266678BB|nr:helix-turn-helix transcriptional regulator [Tunicatimonas pelagia]WKN44414.1 helix-turn-helix transcriptional regulator [Tunicatimonas pelagia]
MKEPIETLTEQERKVASGLAEGDSYQQIADQLGVSINTVRFHIKNIYRKLQVHSKIEVVKRSVRGEL